MKSRKPQINSSRQPQNPGNGQDYILARSTDGLGVQYLVKYGLTRRF